MTRSQAKIFNTKNLKKKFRNRLKKCQRLLSTFTNVCYFFIINAFVNVYYYFFGRSTHLCVLHWLIHSIVPHFWPNVAPHSLLVSSWWCNMTLFSSIRVAAETVRIIRTCRPCWNPISANRLQQLAINYFSPACPSRCMSSCIAVSLCVLTACRSVITLNQWKL